ncbi:MAG TPA: abortive infection family protein [Bacillus sp. (in: firmicutes)]|nr:abortive infection family protein [Bacillus sp. (in: firmicutes)]
MPIDNKTDLPALFTKVRQKLNLDPRDLNLDRSLKEVLTGLIKIVNGITEIRNMHGDSHIPKYKIDRHHALAVVNSAKTVVNFLFNTYEY